jgi:hypothetical protein
MPADMKDCFVRYILPVLEIATVVELGAAMANESCKT